MAQGGGGRSFTDGEEPERSERVDLCKEQQSTERVLDSAAREGFRQVRIISLFVTTHKGMAAHRNNVQRQHRPKLTR